MSKSQLKSRPPVVSDADREKAAESFVSGAKPRNAPRRTTTKASKVLPWEEPYVRDDVKKLLSVRLSEPMMLKLQYVSKQTGTSMNQFSVDAISQAIEAALANLEQ